MHTADPIGPVIVLAAAITAHLRAGDIGRAAGMLTICVAVTCACFLR